MYVGFAPVTLTVQDGDGKSAPDGFSVQLGIERSLMTTVAFSMTSAISRSSSVPSLHLNPSFSFTVAAYVPAIVPETESTSTVLR